MAMEPQSLTFALFIPLLFFFELVLAVDPFAASSPLLSPSPSTPTFAPPPPPKNHVPKIAIPPTGNDDGGQLQRSRGKISRPTSRAGGGLNLGEKVGLSFLAVAVGLQVVLGGLLVWTRIQSRRMERGDLSKTELMLSSSP